MSRLGWVAAAVIAVGGLYLTAITFSGSAEDPRDPATRPNPEAAPPVVRDVGGTRYVETSQPERLLVADSIAPDRDDVALLWLQGRPAVRSPLGRIALDAAGGPITFDGRLVARRLTWRLEGRQPASVAPDGRDGFWIATRTGSIVRIARDGAIADSAVPPFDYSWVAAGADGEAWAFRSPVQFAFPFGRAPAPLVVPLGHDRASTPRAREPDVPIFEHLVNAGRVVPMDDGGFVFAPFIRDEILRFGAHGDTIWRATRGLTHGVEEPSLELGSDGRPLLDYAPVNLGLQPGPDGMLYALATPGHTVERSRLDRIDPASGVVLATTELSTALPTVAVDPDGRVYVLDDFRLLTGVAAAEREQLKPFALEGMDGDIIRLSDYEGRVLIVNFWASWCAPCRTEMPALDDLRSEFPADSLALVAISEDVDRSDARAFVNELGFTFPVAFGDGRMRDEYHYVGLPYTLLIDPRGNVIHRWLGDGRDPQIRAMRALITAELERTVSGPGDEGARSHATVGPGDGEDERHGSH